MALSKIQSESVNLADNFAFTGTVSGAGSEGLVHLETQTGTGVASVKFGNDVVNVNNSYGSSSDVMIKTCALGLWIQVKMI